MLPLADSVPPRLPAKLHVVYRSHGGQNLKRRPPYFDKTLALASMVRAIESLDVEPEVLFVNDGPIPASRLAVMERIGEIVPVVCGSNRRSYRATLDLCALRPWAPDDVVWFAEDDYLYSAGSLRLLMAAVAELPQADYFSMYSENALDPRSTRRRPLMLPLPGAAAVEAPVPVLGHQWYRGISTTSTFGVRAAALRADRGLLKLLPFTGGAWDHTSCLTVQGFQPFPWAEIAHDMLPSGVKPSLEWPRSAAKGVTHIIANLASRRRPDRCRALFAVDPVPILHMELPMNVPGTDWDAVAHETAEWGIANGIPVPSGLVGPAN